MKIKGQTSFAHLFPKKSGCYIIRYKDVVLYIGQAMNLKHRWHDHHHKSFIEILFPDVSIEIMLCEIQELTEMEKNLISRLRPIWNGLDKLTISNMLEVPDDWWTQEFDLEKWFAMESIRYMKMKSRHQHLLGIELKHVTLH